MVKEGKKKKRTKRKIISIITIIIGLFILGLYPALDIYYAIMHAAQGKRIQTSVSSMSTGDYTEYENQAEAYNDALFSGITKEGTWAYDKQLSVLGEGKPFAQLVIPEISLDMPIYHGTTEEVLMNGVGHLEGTSLPVGGTNTHSVLTAHSGMSGMRAFDDIRQLSPGDTFLIKVLGKTLAYKVYKTEVLWPEDVEQKIGIEEGEDLCTLITCTPYGVNDHRLLVYGERTEYHEKMEKQAPSVQKVVTNIRYGPFLLAIIILLILLAINIVRKARGKAKKKKEKSKEASSRTGQGDP